MKTGAQEPSQPPPGPDPGGRLAWADARIGTRFVLTCVALEFVAFGLAGFVSPRLLGTYLTPGRCFFMLGCAAAMFHAANHSSHQRARALALLLTLVFGALTGIGFLWGTPGMRHIGLSAGDARLLVLFDGRVELGYNDHCQHLVLAALFLYATLAPKAWDG